MPRIPKVLVRGVLLALTVIGAVVGLSACGSSDSGGSTATVVKKEAGITKKTNVKVVNKSGRPITIDICHDGVCIGNKKLQEGESDEAAGDDVSGWISYTWGMGNGFQENQYTGVRGNAPGPYQVDWKANNPTIGPPTVDASLPKSCAYHTQSVYGGGNDNQAKWVLGVGDKFQSPGDSLCTYALVVSREADGGKDRVTGAPEDYKMITIEAYAPKAVYVSSRGCTWELTPGPVIKPESPDGSWSCHKPGPRPPDGTPETPDRVNRTGYPR